jgi:hypothetical protein
VSVHRFIYLWSVLLPFPNWGHYWRLGWQKNNDVHKVDIFIYHLPWNSMENEGGPLKEWYHQSRVEDIPELLCCLMHTIYGCHRPVMAGYGVGRRALTATITGLGGLVVAATTYPGPGPTGLTIVRTKYGLFLQQRQKGSCISKNCQLGILWQGQ